jgi:hypothetical protein
MKVADTEALAGLRRLRQRLGDELAAKLGDEATPLAELRELQERVRLLDGVIADPQRLARRKRRATWTALALVAALLSLGALIRMPEVPFSLEAEASAVRLQVSRAGELGAQAVPGEIVLDGFTALESPAADLARRAAAAGVGRLVLSAASLELRRVAFPEATTLDLLAGAQGPSLALHSPTAPIVAQVEVAGRVAARLGSAGERWEGDFAHGEWLQLRAGDAGAAKRPAPPVTLALAAPGEAGYAWSTLRPTEVRFVERGAVAAGDSVVVSSPGEGPAAAAGERRRGRARQRR